jgi:hypothetical protein
MSNVKHQDDIEQALSWWAHILADERFDLLEKIALEMAPALLSRNELSYAFAFPEIMQLSQTWFYSSSGAIGADLLFLRRKLARDHR